MRLAPALPLDQITEKAWTAQLVGTRGNPGLARTLGWTMAYHVLRSKGSEPGFPDWVLARERVIFLELKTELGKVSDAQRGWLRALLDGGAEAYLVRPSDLEDIARVLSQRGDPWQARGPVVGSASRLRARTRDESA